MTWWIGYTLVGLVVAVIALREFAPFSSNGDRAASGAMGLLVWVFWPLILLGWLLARIAEIGQRRR